MDHEINEDGFDLDIIRRIGERGLRLAKNELDNRFIDIFQHLLDELERINKVKTSRNSSTIVSND